jgi:putative ABC transport system permease protein
MIGILRWPLVLARLMGQSILLSLSQVWTNKVRSALTMVGIVIGVASVTAVIAALTGLKTNILKEFETLGTNKIFVMVRRPPGGPMRNVNFRAIAFTPEQLADLLPHCPAVNHITRMNMFADTLRCGEKTVDSTRIVGIDADWHQIENRSVKLGRPFSMVDAERGTNVCLINEKVQQLLALDADCIGQSIYIGSRVFVIIGLLESRAESSMFGGEAGGAEIYVPFSAAAKINEKYMFFFMASSASPEVSEDARAELRFYLRKARHLKPGDQDTFQIEVVEEYLRKFQSMALVITLIAGGVVGISLLVGGVGIMNIMLVSVSERTREIGLRKAVGARPIMILFQFLVEAVILCLLGGLLGLGGGQLLTLVMAAIPDAKLQNAYIPIWAVGLAFGFASLVGVVFGMFPAVKASRLDPIDALRHE